jgi:trimeric autotransporter adhesin
MGLYKLGASLVVGSAALISACAFEGEDSESVEEAREFLTAYNVYLGSFHGHSRASDGDNPPRDVFTWARNSGAFDFYILTDHAELTSSSEYNTNRSLADEFNNEGTFVAMRGFEYSNPLNGHANVFETTGQKAWSILNLTSNSSFYSWVDSNNGIGQFNHPGDYGSFSNYNLSSNVADNFKMMETANGSDKNRSNRFTGYYNTALAKGWKLAPTGNLDNHCLCDYGVRTGVLATSLSRAGIVDAMRNRRVFSSDDPYIEVRFSLGDHWMGEVVITAAGVYTFDLNAVSDEVISRAELVVRGSVAASATFGSNSISWRASLNATSDTYAYVKVFEADGDVAISAPIWIDVP